MSHNSRCYTKKLKKSDSCNTKKIASFFKKSVASSAILEPVTTSSPQTPTECENPTHSDSTESESPIHTSISETDAGCSADEVVSVEYVGKSDSVDKPVSIEKPVSTVQMKFVSPSSPPNKKSRTSEHDSRLFLSARYESRFAWVYYSQTKKGYMCKLCELFSLCDDKSTPYVSCGAILGTHPSRRLEIHENSERHKTAAAVYSKCTTKTIPELLSMKRKSTDGEMVERNRRYIKKLFQTCLFLCEKNWAQSNMEDLVKFMGSTCDADIKLVLAEDSITYLSSTSVSDILKVLSNYFEQKTLAQLREEKFTLLADESTDHSNRTQLSVYARWITPQGPREEYLGLIHVERTTSEALMEATERFLMGKMIPFQNVRFVGLDGCNTMSGCNKGLQRRIRNVSPLCIYVNCRNHRLALCFVHLLKRNDILRDVDTLLLAIWKAFHFSPKKAAVFDSFQEVYGQRPINMVKAATTRWLSHLHASVRFTARYETLLDTVDSLIESTHEPEVRGISSSMTRKQNVAMILVLTDVLKPINFLSLYLQEDCGVFSELPARVKQCRDDLEAIIQQYRQGNYDGLEYSKCEELFFIIDERAALARRNTAHATELTPAGFLQVHGIPLIYSLIAEVEDAFASNDPVLDAFSLLHPCNLPQDIADITAYGEAKARVLSDYYGSERVDVFEGHRTVVPPELGSSTVIYSQLLDFRRQLFMYKENGCNTVGTVLIKLQEDAITRRAYPLIQPLYKLAMLVPQSTAVVERGFSLMNDIATSQRTLGQDTLDSLMRISSFSQSRGNASTLTDSNLNELVDMFKRFRARKMAL